MVISQALEQNLYAAFIAFECNSLKRDGGMSRSFEMSRNGQNGSIQIRVTDMWNSVLMYDGTLRSTLMARRKRRI